MGPSQRPVQSDRLEAMIGRRFGSASVAGDGIPPASGRLDRHRLGLRYEGSSPKVWSDDDGVVEAVTRRLSEPISGGEDDSFLALG